MLMVACVVIAAGIAAALWFTSDTCEIRQLSRQLRRAEGAHRQKILWRLASIRGAQAASIARATLRTDPEGVVREAAAYALAKIGLPDDFEPVRVAADRERPGSEQAKMVTYAARLGRSRSLPWLSDLGKGSPSWAGLGAAIGRLDLGDLSADKDLFDYLKGDDPDRRAFASDWVIRTINTMSETIGSRADVPARPDKGIAPQQADTLITWWRQNVSQKLLADTNSLRERRDPMRRRMGRLMGARKHAMDYLNID
jgi:hypothetical protein